MNRLPAALALVLALAGAALAASLQEARDLYARGSFQEAAQMAAGLRTAPGLALAARSISIHAATRPEREQEALYARAEGHARQAIQADPKEPAGYFELARALGRLSQLRGVVAALFQGIGNQIKDNLDTALRLNPDYPSAMVALGVWHAEISGRGVAWLYGADPAKVAPLFERAIRLEPDVVVHRVEYAKALLLLDRAGNRDRARQQLQAAIAMTPRDAADRLDIERARRELAALG